MPADNSQHPGFRRLSDTATNLYAETLEHLLAEEAAGLDRHLRGQFKRRRLSGGEYWYYQYRDLDQRVRQIYCGPTGGHWDRIALGERSPGPGEGMDRQAQAGLLRAAGLPAVPAGAFRLLAALADAGLFKAGSTLVGTYGYMALGNQLNVAWEKRAATTQDIDIAHSRAVELAVPGAELDLPGVLERLEMGLHPVPKLNPRQPSTVFPYRREDIRLDLLTPTQRGRTQPIDIPALGAPAQPLKFLDYLLKAPQPAVLIGSRVIRVSVPDSARFAIHKLLVSTERPATETAGSHKDRQQATQLFHVLMEERPTDIANAWKAAAQRGRGWTTRLKKALERLPPATAQAVSQAT